MHRGLSDRLLDAHVPLEASISGWVASEDQPTFIDEHSAPRQIRAFCQRPDLSSALSVPVQRADQVVGVLNLARRVNEYPYTQDDLCDLLAFVKSWEYLNARVGRPALVRSLQ